MRAVAILSGVSTHLDHLGVLSAILEIPLIVTDEKTYQLAKRYYPFCAVQLCEPSDLSLEYLAQSYDVIFETGHFFRAELAPALQLLYGKQMRFVYCPHGYSDKSTEGKQDIALVYSETGNYRLPFYLQHKAFYDARVNEVIRFKKRLPIALYAPTWHARETPSSFLSSTQAIIEELGGDLNLIIKPHPYLFEQYPAQVIAVMGRYENHPSVHFLTDFPPIYPLLDKCAFYIGDYSSIGYDFLAYDRPLFFLPSDGPMTALHQCGTCVHSLKQLLISEDTFSEARRKLYAQVFGEEKPFDVLRKAIYSSLKEGSTVT